MSVWLEEGALSAGIGARRMGAGFGRWTYVRQGPEGGLWTESRNKIRRYLENDGQLEGELKKVSS